MAISWKVKVNSEESCFEKVVSFWKWKWALILNLWECNIKKYQAIDFELSNLDSIYEALEKIFKWK